MADNQLSFTTRVDLSGLTAGSEEAKVILEELGASTGAAMQQEADAFNAVSEAFAQFDTLLAEGIAENEAYKNSIAEIAAAYEVQVTAQTAAQQEAAAATAAQAIAETMLAGLSEKRTAQEIASANTMRGIYAARASETMFAVESNASYAASVAQVMSAYQALTGVQAEQAAAQTEQASAAAAALTATTEAEAGFGTTVEEANALLEAQGVLWMQNQQAATDAAASTEAAAAANEDAAASMEDAAVAATDAADASMTLEEAQQAASIAAKNLADAQLQLGASARAGNEAAIAIIREYEAEVARAQETVAALTAAEGENAAAVDATSAALTENTLALRENTAAEFNRAEAMGAARVSAGLMEGSLNAVDYGLARVAASSRILGPILEAVFPIAAIAAGVFIVYQLASAFQKAYDEAEQSAQKIQEAWRQEDDQLTQTADNLTVTNDKLENTLLKLEGKPGNGLQLGLDEARQAADALASSLDKDIQKEDELMKKTRVGFFAQLMGKASTDADAKDITGFQQRIQAISDSYTETIDDAVDRGASQKNIADIKAAELSKLEDVYAEATKTIGERVEELERVQTDPFYKAGGGQDLQPRINQLRAALEAWRQEQRTIGEDFRKSNLEEAVAPLQKTGGGGADHADQDRLRAIQDQFAQLNAAEAAIKGHGLTAGEGAAFWSQYLSTFAEGSAQAKAILTSFMHEQETMHRQIGTALKREEGRGGKDADARDLEKMEASQVKLSALFEKDAANIMHSGEAWRGYATAVERGQEITEENAIRLQAEQSVIDEADGKITRLGAAHLTAAQHAEEYRTKLAALEAELKSLQAAANYKIDPVTGAETTSPKNAQAIQQVQNQIAQLTGQHAVQGLKDNEAQTQALAAPYLKAFDAINTGFLKVQHDMIAGNKNIAQSFALMGGDLVQSAAVWTEKLVADWIRHEIVKVAASDAANAQVVAGAAAATAAQDSLSAISTLKIVTNEAVKAAAKAFTWGTDLGGPIVGAIAAGVTFAAVESLGALTAFDTGGIIPGSGAVPILGHGGERVLTERQTGTFEQFVSNMNNTTTQGGNTIHANVTQNFPSAKASSAHETRAAVQSLIRRGQLRY